MDLRRGVRNVGVGIVRRGAGHWHHEGMIVVMSRAVIANLLDINMPAVACVP